ncbi:protein Bouncer-like [Corythoichthys intestinalis]|uniref:protein Bouncer-like n=1 Tax=Corythoichthys intestinalis TaxID=161448 RepID=UPI0025A52F00|nr:protein Bouncer-like [Corythoichthys intestinalis]XP_061789622.1 protein Bouncer-like [Nerophis lumbriciformis]XP_061812067.1 protein Bouncer-like [Nerophis lumbriciformis]
MKGLTFCVLAVIMFIYVQGEEEETLEQVVEAAGFIEEEELLQCFRCDLGFWDACYTTETNCSLGERCFTGRGKAVDSLDVKTLGCVKLEECNVETTVEFFNNTIFVMTKHCCDTPFCNIAFKPKVDTLLCITVAFLISWCTVVEPTH